MDYSDFEEPEVREENQTPCIPNERDSDGELPVEKSIEHSNYQESEIGE